MIDPRELRIGNFVYVTNPSDPIEITITSFSDAAYFEPIPITEELLINLGFINYKLNSYYKDCGEWPNQRTVSIFWDGNEFILEYFKSKIKYVHQLQNLYFALTGEELTINN